MNAALTSLNTAFLPISRSHIKRRLISLLISLTTVWWVLCKFLGDFLAFWERDIFFSKDRLNRGNYEMLKI